MSNLIDLSHYLAWEISDILPSSTVEIDVTNQEGCVEARVSARLDAETVVAEIQIVDARPFYSVRIEDDRSEGVAAPGYAPAACFETQKEAASNVMFLLRNLAERIGDRVFGA